jgi:hypothetical protein
MNLPRLPLLNATSLAKSFTKEQLLADALAVKADILLITETWFNSKITDEDLNLQDYVLLRHDRASRKGGGVCAYVRASFGCVVYHPFGVEELEDVETLWLKISMCELSYFIAACYHPPHSVYQPSAIVSQLSDSIESIVSRRTNILIVVAGDFNSLNTGSLASNCELYQLVKEPTNG